MKLADIVFSFAGGLMASFLISDFLKEWGISLGLYYFLLLCILLSFLILLCLWLAYLVSSKFLFIFQAVKHLLVGMVATIIDLKIFELLIWLFIPIPLISKGVSFLVATFFKYWGNKYWAFQKHEKENTRREVTQFFLITLVGLIIDVGFFFYFVKIMGSQFEIPTIIWIKLSVIFAALIAALWNFLGYKFIVFKK